MTQLHYTKANLQAFLDETNHNLLKESSDYSFKYRYIKSISCHAVDLYKDGECLRCIYSDDILVLIAGAVEDEFYNLIGE